MTVAGVIPSERQYGAGGRFLQASERINRMKEMTFTRRPLPQAPDIEVLVPNYKEPILPVNHGGFGWYGLQAYNEEGQLMCHACGEFRDCLGLHVHNQHKLTSLEYRNKYGLLRKTRLVSASTHQKKRDAILHNKERMRKAWDNFELVRNRSGNKVKAENTGCNKAEYQNLLDTCNGQLIRRLIDLSLIHGDDISMKKVREADRYLVGLLINRFGSFNKAKQMARLKINAVCNERYDKESILIDACNFFAAEGHWPTAREYRKRDKTICCDGTLRRFGGLLFLRQEAMKMKEEQDARAEVAERIPAHAVAIEMEYAGYARR